MNNNDGSLLSFLKKNAAYSSGIPSSKKDSESGSFHTFNERNPAVSAPYQSYFNQPSPVTRQDNSFYGGRDNYGAGNRGNEYIRVEESSGRTMGRLDEDMHSLKSYISNTSNRTTSSGFESARGEAVGCLNNLSETIRKEISTIDHKL
jgi:hypothetical protein